MANAKKLTQYIIIYDISGEYDHPNCDSEILKNSYISLINNLFINPDLLSSG